MTQTNEARELLAECRGYVAGDKKHAPTDERGRLCRRIDAYLAKPAPDILAAVGSGLLCFWRYEDCVANVRAFWVGLGVCMLHRAATVYAVALGRKGGLKGGAARAAKMTPEERSESARKAVQARWAKTKQD